MFDLLESSIRKLSHNAEYLSCKENVENCKQNSESPMKQSNSK